MAITYFYYDVMAVVKGKNGFKYDIKKIAQFETVEEARYYIKKHKNKSPKVYHYMVWERTKELKEEKKNENVCSNSIRRF